MLAIQVCSTPRPWLRACRPVPRSSASAVVVDLVFDHVQGRSVPAYPAVAHLTVLAW